MDKEARLALIKNGVGQFATEDSVNIDDTSPLFDPLDYPPEQRELINECNRRIEAANNKYRVARFREDMFAKGLQSGLFFCSFDHNEKMTSFEFSDETRQMLGYSGLEDLPNSFDSWVKVLVPEEKEELVKLFWDSIAIHHDLPDITHATFRMRKKNGDIIWVTGAGRFIRREDGSLEFYMGCYRDITAQVELKEHVRIVEAISKVFNFSMFIDVKDMSYRMISTNKYVEMVPKCPDALQFLKDNVTESVAESFHQSLFQWLDKDKILQALEEHGKTTMEFYSESANRWFNGIFMIGDRDENGKIAHIVYGCADTTDAKLQNLAQQKIISKFEAEVYTDSLSKIRNRRYLDEKLIYEPCNAVVMADIDHFKMVNDTVGHQGGDEAIQKVARLLEQSVRCDDVVLRYGGDEFMIIFFDITKDGLQKKLSAIKQAVRTITIDPGADVLITMSFGAAYGMGLVSNMIAPADQALYDSKKVRDTFTLVEI
jgi:diguanylate cyclase (GGDEF)-like protein/PAS domain S-box-containing protein